MESNTILRGYEQRVFSLNAELATASHENSQMRHKNETLKAENLTLMEKL